MAKLFRGFKPPRKANRHLERYERRFWKLKNIRQGKSDLFRGKIERSLVSLRTQEVENQKKLND